MNVVILEGRLTGEPTIRMTNSGKKYASFNLAVEKDFKNANGEKEADFINCCCWDKAADFAQTWLNKGKLVQVQGSIQTRNYDDMNGRKVYVTEVLAHKINFAPTNAKINSKEETVEAKPNNIDMMGMLPF